MSGYAPVNGLDLGDSKGLSKQNNTGYGNLGGNGTIGHGSGLLLDDQDGASKPPMSKKRTILDNSKQSIEMKDYSGS